MSKIIFDIFITIVVIGAALVIAVRNYIMMKDRKNSRSFRFYVYFLLVIITFSIIASLWRLKTVYT